MNKGPDTPFSYHTPPPKRVLRLGWIKWVVAIVVVVGAGAGIYLVKPEVVRPYLEGTPLELPREAVTAYKWRGADGSWRFTENPPPAGTPYETMEVTGDIMIVPSATRR